MNARAGDVFRNGQIFLAVCSGSSSYAYFTASETVQVAAAGVSSITLAPATTSNPFLRQDVAVASACFSAGVGADPARLFLVNRYRFHVRPVITGTLGAATQYDPLLVLDQGIDLDLDGDVDANDELLIAEGIESIQVVLPLQLGRARAGGDDRRDRHHARGMDRRDRGHDRERRSRPRSFPGHAREPGPTTAYTPSSFYPYTFGPPAAAERGTNHQANVQAIRVSRAGTLDRRRTSRARTRADGFLPLLNQARLPAWVDRLRRGTRRPRRLPACRPRHDRRACRTWPPGR